MIINDIALTLEEKVSPQTAAHLVERFGSAQAVYDASAQQLIAVAELNPQLAAQLSQKSKHKRAAEEIKYMQKYGIQAVEATSELYPQMLKECDDYPHVMYFKGDPSVLNATTISMVGTRNVSEYGRKMCDYLIGSLAQIVPDLVVVSGLAYGVDVECHRAAIRYGLRTVGVIANPLPAITPVHHSAIADDMIRRGGGVVSELNSAAKPHKGMFNRRNRIIVGLSMGTVIVESGQGGGSLISAAHADGYNRVVMAVPGRVGDVSSVGTNALIRNLKARLITSGADIACELGWNQHTSQADNIDTSSWSTEQIKVYRCFADGQVYTIDMLEELSGYSINVLLSELLNLVCDGYIRDLSGNRYEKFSNFAG